MLNNKVGKLRIEEQVSANEWKCTCECGNTVILNTQEIFAQEKAKACSIFRGEVCAAELFDELGIEYVAQKKFDDTDLVFDFYLPQANVIIESDGAQHFRTQNSNWDSKCKLQETYQRDIAKNKYCKEHNITLIRISFWDRKKLNKEYLSNILKQL